MNIETLVKTWFEKWENGDFYHLPVTDDFKHTSPFGTIDGKQQYIRIVEANKEKFLNHKFEIHDVIYDRDKACVRYTAIQEDFRLDVSEWYYAKGDLIGEIMAYYHIGEVRDDRKLSDK